MIIYDSIPTNEVMSNMTPNTVCKEEENDNLSSNIKSMDNDIEEF
jgi:hypothetical protein